MKVIYLAILVWILVMNLAMAGERIGNGGDILICPQEVVTLDYYEAALKGAKQFTTGQTIREIYKKIHSRLTKLDVVTAYRVNLVAEKLLTDVESFELNVSENQIHTLFTDDELVDLDDSNELFIPQNCTKKQIAINNRNSFSLDKKFLINKKLWNRIDLNQKAYLIYHEALYDVLSDMGAKDSSLARYLVGIFISDLFEKYSLNDFLRDMSHLKSFQYYISTNGFSNNRHDRGLSLTASEHQLRNCPQWVTESLRPRGTENNCLRLNLIPPNLFYDNPYSLQFIFPEAKPEVVFRDFVFLPFAAVIAKEHDTRYLLGIPLSYSRDRYIPMEAISIGSLTLNGLTLPDDWEEIIASLPYYELYSKYPIALMSMSGEILSLRYQYKTLKIHQ